MVVDSLSTGVSLRAFDPTMGAFHPTERAFDPTMGAFHPTDAERMMPRNLLFSVVYQERQNLLIPYNHL
jgi:hypothetical protein